MPNNNSAEFKPEVVQDIAELSTSFMKDDLYRARSSRDAARMLVQGLSAVGALDLGFLTDGKLAPGDFAKTATTSRILSSIDGTLATTYAVNVVFGGLFIALIGTADQRAHLRNIASGHTQVALAMTEPQAGSDAAGVEMTATAVQGGYLLEGEKIFTTGAQNADLILVVARRAERSVDPKALSIFLVPAHAGGLSIEPLPKLAGEQLASCRVTLKGVHVTADTVLGGEAGLDDAWRWMRLTGTTERLTIAAEATGLAEAVVRRAAAYARERFQFGQPIEKFQAISHRLVEMKTTQTTMRLLLDHAVTAMETKADATEEVCMAKFYCAERLQEIVASGMRIMGGRAFFDLEDMSRFYRQAPLSLYAGGTVEVMKNILARYLHP